MDTEGVVTTEETIGTFSAVETGDVLDVRGAGTDTEEEVPDTTPELGTFTTGVDGAPMG